MSEYPLKLEEIVVWLRSNDQVLNNLVITLADVRESHTNKSAAAANFDTAQAVGQICVWVSGEIDFQVLRASDGKDVYTRHQKVSSLSEPSLESAYKGFLQRMTHPDDGS
jgi:hypothetical protein